MARNRLTLLEIVQSTLDKLGSDSVNSISDTSESTIIAEEAKHTYYELMDRDEWPHLVVNRQLEAVADTNTPNYLKIPKDVSRIDDFRYEIKEQSDTNKYYRQIHYKNTEDFLQYVHQRNTDEPNVIQVSDITTGIPLWIIDDEPPCFWTSFDDEHIVTDSYDKDVDSTLQQSKSIIRAKVTPTWSSTDTFIPDMPDQMFSTYLAEVAAAAFTYLRQEVSPKDEQRARRGLSKLRRQAGKVNERDPRAKFGRTSGRTHAPGSNPGELWP